MKVKITILIILCIITACYWGNRFSHTFTTILESDQIKENAAYTDECILGQLVKLKDESVLYFHIADNEILIDKLNIKNKNTENYNKITKDDLDGALFSFPNIQSKPQFIELKNGNIFITLRGLKGKDNIVRFAFLYNPYENTFKKMDLSDISLETEVYAFEDRFVITFVKDSEGLDIKIFDNEGNLINDTFLKDKTYIASSALKNEEILVLNFLRLPAGTFDINTYKFTPFAKPLYGAMEEYTELDNGNLLFETKKGEKSALEIYDINKKEFSIVIDDIDNTNGLKTGIALGIIKLENGNYIQIGKDYYYVNLLDKTYGKIDKMEETRTSFPMILAVDRILIDRKDGIKILNLTDGSMKDAKKIKSLIGNVSYPMSENKSIVINTLIDETLIYDKEKNEFKKGPRSAHKFFKNHPVQIIELDDGRIILHYSIIYSTFEKKFGGFGRILDYIMTPLCKGAVEGACMKYEKAPYYSRVYTEIY